jgi:hypothetical protein
MKRLAVLVAAAATLVTLTPAAASSVEAVPIQRVRAGTAKNWAGYIAHGGPFTSASTSWTEPSIRCAANEKSALASFAGIDGAGSSTVEQIGTLANCRNGRVTHQGFYEMFPRSAFAISKKVRAGDSLTATVVASAPSTFTLTLVNRTAGWTFSTKARSAKAKLASAEAITEAPSLRGSGIVPLANFGQINYSGTTANGQAISAFNPEAVTMVTNSGAIKAAPTGLSGGSFSVVWHHA